MEPRKHRTPSGLPPANFEEGADVWDFVQKPQNELELILKHGVWAPQTHRRQKLRSSAAGGAPAQAEAALFAANSPSLSAAEIVGWWEKRRLVYNAILLGVGAIALCFLWVVTLAFRYKMQGLSDALSRGDTLLDAPALAWLAITANAVFTLGWCGDVTWRLLVRQPRHCRQSASLLHIALTISLICIGVIAVLLLHFAIAH